MKIHYVLLKSSIKTLNKLLFTIFSLTIMLILFSCQKKTDSVIEQPIKTQLQKPIQIPQKVENKNAINERLDTMTECPPQYDSTQMWNEKNAPPLVTRLPFPNADSQLIWIDSTDTAFHTFSPVHGYDYTRGKLEFKMNDSINWKAFCPQRYLHIPIDSLSDCFVKGLSKYFYESGALSEIYFETNITKYMKDSYYVLCKEGILNLDSIYIRVILQFGMNLTYDDERPDEHYYECTGVEYYWDYVATVSGVDGIDGGFIIKNKKPELLYTMVPVNIADYDTLLYGSFRPSKDKLTVKDSYSCNISTDTLIFVQWDVTDPEWMCGKQFSLLSTGVQPKQLESIIRECDP